MANFIGTSGDDFINGTASDDTITALEGNDLVNAGEGNDVVDGGDGHDNLRGEGGNDLLLGGNGDDYLRGGPGNDIINGGAGFDRVAFFTATSGITVDLRIQGTSQNTGLGLDTLIGIEHASGTEFTDVIDGDDGDNWLWGENGDDTINAHGGNDLVEVGPGAVIADGGTGNDTFSVWANNAALAGVSVSLLLQGGAQATGIGSMTISGFENLSGSAGNDTLTGDGGINILAGDTGNDLLSGGASNDTLYGDGRIIIDTHNTGLSGPFITYADIEAAFPGSEFIDGDDVLEGGDGNDQLFGGGGSDTATYASASGAVFVNLSSGIASGAAGVDSLNSIENVTGSAFDDNIRGDGGDNVLAGGDGHDFMRGLDGNDTMLGGNGDDYLDGGLGDDFFDGGAGWDRVSYAVGALNGVSVSLTVVGSQSTGAGEDTLVNIEHLSGTKFNDVLTGNAGDNWIWGGSDNSGVTGDDIILAGLGNDLVWVGNGNHVINGDAGTDTLGTGNDADIAVSGVNLSLALQGAPQSTGNGSWNFSGFENLSGSGYGDHLTGDGGDNVLAGALGDDVLSGGAGADTLYGDGAITVDTHGIGGSGPIVTYGDVTVLDPLAVAGNDILQGGDGDDSLWGGGGSDTASYAGGGEIFVNLAAGFETDSAGTDNLHSIENVVGSAFDDQILGDAAANTLTGGDGHDYMRGIGGNDTLIGGNGDDYLGGGFGDDVIDGGAGWDRAAFVHNATTGVHVDLNIQGVAQNTGQGMDTLIGIEHASGTSFDDVLIGNGGDNWLWGEEGNDTFAAGAGNDLVEVGTGNHVADGGTGNDTLSFFANGTGVTANVTVSLLLQGAAQATGAGSMTLTGFENVSGSYQNDTLTGDGAVNVLAGDVGNDTLNGGDGNDTLYGDGRIIVDVHGVGTSGPITTFADVAATFPDDPEIVSGNDVLNGGKGNDTLVGGGGDDLLTGGQGQDTFVFGPASGDDHVTDFAKKDVIAINGVAGVDDFSDLTIVNVGGNAVISWGTGDSITLDGYKANKLSAADFSFGASAPFAAMAVETHGHHGFEAPPADAWMP